MKDQRSPQKRTKRTAKRASSFWIKRKFVLMSNKFSQCGLEHHWCLLPSRLEAKMSKAYQTALMLLSSLFDSFCCKRLLWCKNGFCISIKYFHCLSSFCCSVQQYSSKIIWTFLFEHITKSKLIKNEFSCHRLLNVSYPCNFL